MEPGERSTCRNSTRIAFLVTLVLSFLSMVVMNATMVDLHNQMPSVVNSMINAINVSRHGLTRYINNFDDATDFKNRASSSKMSDLSFVEAGGVTNTTKRSKEFPWMPDPCAKPRRQTGVEDLLCMTPPRFLPDYKNPCYQDGHTLRCLPYFHLIGICKSGTSDFFTRLYLHPDIVPNKGVFGKELWYWSWRRLGFRSNGKGMTLVEFTRHFYPERIKTARDVNGYHYKITGHGDPMDVWDRGNEINTPQNDPKAEELLWTTPYSVYHINPKVKLMLMLRDPVDRLYSHYFHSGGKTAQDFHQKVVESLRAWNTCLSRHTLRHCIYDKSARATFKVKIHTSFYVIHVKEWLKVFPRDQLFVFRNEDFTKDVKGTMTQIFEFLDVSIPSYELFTKMRDLSKFYVSKKKATAGPMKPETRKLLVDLYRPYTEELAEVLGDKRFAFHDTSFS